MRVLIIDDSKTIRNIMKATLASINVTTVEEAGDGQDALAKMEAFKPDLMLCDWNMPVMDGITFVRQLRGKSDRTPVIMITTEAEKARVIEAIKAGVSNYAIKPFTPDTLKEVIHKTLDRARPAA
jgi:two-component system chemotaxis response regulator CheY